MTCCSEIYLMLVYQFGGICMNTGNSLHRRSILKGVAAAAGSLAVPNIARAQPTTTIINPNGQAYIKSPADVGPIGTMAALASEPKIRYRDVPRPYYIPDNHSRLTFAVDVCALSDYFSIPGAHIVVASRVNINDPLDVNGGNAWQGIIAGELWGAGRVMAEERRFPQNLHQWETGVNAVFSYQWYRFVVDTVKWMGYRMYECRVYSVQDELNNVLGPRLYKSQSIYSLDSGFADTNTVAFVNVSETTDKLIVGRVAAHWTEATEWLETP